MRVNDTHDKGSENRCLPGFGRILRVSSRHRHYEVVRKETRDDQTIISDLHGGALGGLM